MSFSIVCDLDGCCNAQGVEMDEAGRPVVPGGWLTRADGSHVCLECQHEFADELGANS